MSTTKRFDWKVFLVLWGGAIAGVIAILPYVFAVQANVLQNIELALPLWVLIPIQIVQNAVLLAIATALGLFLAHRIGLGAPILEGLFAHERVGERFKALLAPSILWGVLGSLVIIGLDVFVFAPLIQGGGPSGALDASVPKPAAWQGFLASFYGGIDEEILMRLLLLSLLAFVGKFISHTADGRPTVLVLWVANILVAVLFGLGHLPITATLISITPLIVARAIVLNGLLAIGFGYLYWTRGIEAAMVSHFAADMVLHVLLAI